MSKITKYYAQPAYNTWAKTGYLFDFGGKGKWFLCEYLYYMRPVLFEKYFQDGEEINIVFGGYQKFDSVGEADQNVSFENFIQNLINKGLIPIDSDLYKFYETYVLVLEKIDKKQITPKLFNFDYLRVENFRNIKTPSAFELRPLTFITGKNNSGKSSVLKSLLLLRELEYDQQLDAFIIVDSKDLNLEMNELANFNHRNNPICISINLDYRIEQYPNELIKIEFSFDNIQENRCLKLNQVIIDFVDSPFDYDFILKLIVDKEGHKRLEIEKAIFGDLTESNLIIHEFDKSAKGLGFNNLFNSASQIPLIDLLTVNWKQNNVEIDNAILFQLEKLFADIALIVGQDLKNKIVHVKSLRSELERTFLEGKSQLGATLELLSNSINLSVPIRKLEEWFVKFGLNKKWRVTKQIDGSYKITFDEFNIADLGYGYMQIFTVLVQSVFASSYNKSIVVIEEPESNLHPNLQSLLAEFFYDIHLTFGTQFLIETHSEYMIRKTQLIGKNFELFLDEKKNPFNVIYFDKEKGPYNMVYRHDGKFINEFGSGFFDETRNIIKHLL